MYAAPNRSMGTDRRGLELHAEPLVQLFQVAPNGFPCHRGVREALLALNAELKIFSCEERYAFKVSNEAADVWRVMAKDTRNLKKRMSTASILGLALPLQHLLAHVVLQAEDEYVVSQNVQGDNSDHDVDGFDTDKVEEATQRDGQTLELEDIHGLFDADFKDIADPDIVSIDNDDGGELADVMQPESEIEPAVEFVSIDNDDGEELADVMQLESEIEPAVEFVSEICRCPECVAKAKRPIPIPNPGIGSQRRETLAVVQGKVRLHSKTTVQSKEPKKGVQTKLKKHAGPIALPIQLVHRKMSTKNRKQEAYLLGGGTYIASMSIRTNPSYLKAMQKLKTLIEKGDITTVRAAREWVASQAHG